MIFLKKHVNAFVQCSEYPSVYLLLSVDQHFFGIRMTYHLVIVNQLDVKRMRISSR